MAGQEGGELSTGGGVSNISLLMNRQKLSHNTNYYIYIRVLLHNLNLTLIGIVTSLVCSNVALYFMDNVSSKNKNHSAQTLFF